MPGSKVPPPAARVAAGAAAYNMPFLSRENPAVPDVALGKLRRFDEPEGGTLAVAQQLVQFRLDRGGAQLKAEAVVARPSMAEMVPQCYFSRPFPLLMKKRGAARPYLAVWIHNAEILDPR